MDSPYGLGERVTSGIIMPLGRTGLVIRGYKDLIKTEASINPGNSGGALVNQRGALVVFNTAILAPTGGIIGIGFAIPANLARGVMQQLVEYGQVERGQLGILVQDLTPQLAQAFGIPRNRGAVISRVSPNSAADQAGLRAGDVVVAVNGKPIRNATDLRNTIGLLRVDERVKLDILRDGRAMTITARMGEQVSSTVTGEGIHPRLVGATFSELNSGSPRQGEGVLMADVEPGSPAARTGLRKGDIIISVNRRPVNSLNAFQQAVGSGNALLLNIQRGRASLFIVIR
jgi:serine protease Do/serine protease DegQ